MPTRSCIPSSGPTGLETLDARAACATCGGARCETGAESNVENCELGPALAFGRVDLITGVFVTRLEVGPRRDDLHPALERKPVTQWLSDSLSATR